MPCPYGCPASRWSGPLKSAAPQRQAVRPTEIETRRLAAYLAMSDTMLFGLCLAFTPLSTAVGIPWVGYKWGDWHSFVAPHVILSGGLAVLCACALSNRPGTSVAPIATLSHSALAATYAWAILRWPGGDDGGGMAWQLIIGPLTALSLLFAAGLARAQIRQNTGHRLREWRGFGGAIVVVALAFSVLVLLPWLVILLHFRTP